MIGHIDKRAFVGLSRKYNIVYTQCIDIMAYWNKEVSHMKVEKKFRKMRPEFSWSTLLQD